MKNVLITGATGNIGLELIHALGQKNSSAHITAGVRDINRAKDKIHTKHNIDFVHFDFMDPKTFPKALKDIDLVFLLRPPHISDVKKFFKPLITEIKEAGINQIIFLSVQGAEKSSIIPHNKIEQLIKEHSIDHIFLRPSYFMQNLTTTLLHDIKTQKAIILPSGKAKFNWIDISNIAEIAAIMVDDFDKYRNRSIELTGNQNLNFYEIVSQINKILDLSLIYRSVNPFTFYKIKRQNNTEKGLIIVMLMLHFLPKFQKPPQITLNYEMISGKSPTDIESFIRREKHKLLTSTKI
jgi:uncharacterized protein YbjT (DUF2867 family)